MTAYPSTAILDGDIIVYRLAHICDVEGVHEAEGWLDSDIKDWTPPGCKKVLVALSCQRKDNFRRDWWPDYKVHRDARSHEPECLGTVRDLCRKNFECIEVPRLEADDIMGMYMSREEAVVSTIDKDLKCVPGWLWNPTKDAGKKPSRIHEVDADYWFHLQWLMGDSTDNIPGIYRTGIKKAEAILEAAKSPLNWTAAVRAAYETSKYDYDEDYCRSQGACVRILRDGEWSPDDPSIPLTTAFLG